MNSENPLQDWQFLIGEWKGGLKDQFNIIGELKVEATFSLRLDGQTIFSEFVTKKEDKIINQSISFMFYDILENTFRRKTLFSYGFVNNEVGYKVTTNEIRFNVTSEPLPKQFEGLRWRSYLIKVSETKILMGLEQAKEGGEFQLYGESVLTKIN